MRESFHFHHWVRTGLAEAPGRFQRALRDALAASMAAVLAWELARMLWGHPRPVFAAVTALVCLAPGLPSHLRQATGLLLGCVTGIVVGELAWLLPDTIPMLRLGLAVLCAMLAATVLSPAPVVAIQAGVSVVLVLAMGPSTAGEVRLLDVLLGAATGLLFSQVLFTSNPLRALSRAAQTLLRELAQGLDATVDAVVAHDTPDALQALGQLTRASDSLMALRAAMQETHNSRRWSLRGRMHARHLDAVSQRYDRHAVRVYASSLLLAESLVAAMGHDSQIMPPVLQARCRWLVQACGQLAQDGQLVALRAKDPLAKLALAEPVLTAAWVQSLQPAWQPVLEQAEQLEHALRALVGSQEA